MSSAPLILDKLQPQTLALPAISVLAVNAREAAILSVDGEISLLPHAKAQMALAGQPVMVCHAPYTRQRIGTDNLPTLDVLELFAFVHPAKFCVPTPAGLAKVLGLPVPKQFEDLPLTIMETAQALLRDLQKAPPPGNKNADPLEIVRAMGQNGAGWGWTPSVCAALEAPYNPDLPVMSKAAFNIWKNLPEWAEGAPPTAPSHHPVTGEESRARLTEMLGNHSENREKQFQYATALAKAFLPAGEDKEPHLILAEAGTGIGKTLGYLAPASVWAEKNDGTVWVSTFTKNLQRQVDQELGRLYSDPELKDKKTAVRKGRENYLCLLNLEDTVAGAALSRHPQQAVAAGIMARWAEATRDGDMQGGDFPGWLPGLLGHQYTRGLADKRGECIYGACDHYHKCFIERATRKAQRANIVVANHALVMRLIADSGLESTLPQRYVFDEGHHLFDAADSAFAGHLTARETGDVRRWILGAEGGKKSRARGLKRRIEDLIAGDAESEAMLQDIVHTAHTLAGPGWSRRLKDGQAKGATEEFLHLVHAQIMARTAGREGSYSLETEAFPLIDGLAEASRRLKCRLHDLQKPMKALTASLRKKMADNAATWDSDTRKRVESVCISMGLRILHITAWIGMLETLDTNETPPEFVDWMEIVKVDGQSWDVGMYRHYIDPMAPFAATLKPHAHGIVITSATLRGRTGNEALDWAEASRHTGAGYLSPAPDLFSAPSPYDYASQTKVFIITDVRKDDFDQVASAYRALFEAAGGGGLGLFTAISRLRAVHERILLPLEDRHGLRLYAQHMDAMDNGTLVDVFREDTHACLLGTDAVRDGIDVPGESLRLLVYDRVPWPRPTILHKARRKAFGGKDYDDSITRQKLRQAYGRLIRRATDKGVFVMLDSMLPSRLLTSFPAEVEAQRVGLAEAAGKIRAFLQNT